MKSLRELSDSKLFSSSKSACVIIEEDRKTNFDTTTTWDDSIGFKDSLDNTEGVVH